MKKLLLGLAVVSLMIGYAYADDSMVLYLTFDEGSGNTVADSSVYGNDGEIVDTANAGWGEGQFGSALEITAETTDAVVIPNSDSLMLEGAISVMAWIKPTKWSSGESTHVVDKGVHTADTAFSYGFEVRQGNLFVLFVGTGENREAAYIEQSLELGEWKHVAATYDNSDGGKFYMDGVLVGAVLPVGVLQATNDAEVRIGSAKERAQYGFVGSIDEFVMFNSAISEAEVNSIMAGGPASASSEGKLATTWASIKE